MQFDGTASRSNAMLLLATSKQLCNTNEGQVNSMVVFKTNGLLASTGSIHLERLPVLELILCSIIPVCSLSPSLYVCVYFPNELESLFAVFHCLAKGSNEMSSIL